MKKKLVLGLCTMIIGMQSCINEDYNLSDLDTSVAIPVEDLKVPLNLDDIQLQTVLDVSEDSKIKNHKGEYAVVINGEFETENIIIDNITAKSSELSDIVGKSRKKEPLKSSGSRRGKSTSTNVVKAIAEYGLPQEKINISINAEKVSNAIKSLKSLNIDTKVCAEIVLDKKNALYGILKTQRVEDFSFKIPRGFDGRLHILSPSGIKITADTIDSNKGIAKFHSNEIITTDGKLQLEFEVKSINENILNETLKQLEYNKSFILTDSFGVDNGKIVVYNDDFVEELNSFNDSEKYQKLPNELDYNSAQNMNDIKVNSFSGKLDYVVKKFDIDPIDMTDVPDMLNQTGTYLRFDNPQIYLKIENPVEDGKGTVVPATTSFDIISVDKEGNKRKYAMDADQIVNADKHISTFYLSPQMVEDKVKYEGYENAKHVKYQSLSDILTGGNIYETLGIPTSLVVETNNSKVESENVEDFKFGRDIGTLKGTYTFYAPLAMTEGSRIKYAKTIDGWNTSELDKVAISRLKINCKVSTDIPFLLDLKIIPIDKNGERINASTSAVVVENANEQDLELEMNGDIRNLDGIIVEVVADAKSNNVLRPNMKIRLGSIKATISGLYQN